nr:putative metallopeptidase [Acinetobacter baumannii]
MIVISSTGLPKHYLSGHDVEELVGVTKRWGSSQRVKRIVEAAKNKPFVSKIDISNCCGNCVIN